MDHVISSMGFDGEADVNKRETDVGNKLLYANAFQFFAKSRKLNESGENCWEILSKRSARTGCEILSCQLL